MKFRRPAHTQCRVPFGICGVLLSMALLLQSCASPPQRNPLPEENYAEARVLGASDFRFWGNEPPPVAAELGENATLEELRTVLPGLVDRELHFLAISGGGENGAFAAGLLNGWTVSGTRPEFNVVTGISTGALLAPFAYLGPAYDHVLERFYTQYSTDDLIRNRGWLHAITTDAGYDTAPMRSLIAEYVDEEVMEAIALRGGRIRPRLRKWRPG